MVLVTYLRKDHWIHDDVMEWKHFPRYWSFARGIYWSPVTSPHKGPWRGALMFSLICAWTNDWVNSRDAGDLRRRRAHYDATVMSLCLNHLGLDVTGMRLITRESHCLLLWEHYKQFELPVFHSSLWRHIRAMTSKNTDNSTVCSTVVLDNNKENIKVPHYWSFVKGIHLKPMDIPHKGLMLWKTTSPYRGIIMPDICHPCRCYEN